MNNRQLSDLSIKLRNGMFLSQWQLTRDGEEPKTVILNNETQCVAFRREGFECIKGPLKGASASVNVSIPRLGAWDAEDRQYKFTSDDEKKLLAIAAEQAQLTAIVEGSPEPSETTAPARRSR
jgi:hypothetical protein